MASILYSYKKIEDVYVVQYQSVNPRIRNDVDVVSYIIS